MLNVSTSGYLAANPRSNTIGQTEVTNFRLLVNKKIKDQEYVTQIDCSVWGPRAQAAATYLSKGSKVFVTGSGHAEAYLRRDGSAGCTIVMRVDDFDLATRSQREPEAPAEEEEIPF